MVSSSSKFLSRLILSRSILRIPILLKLNTASPESLLKYIYIHIYIYNIYIYIYIYIYKYFYIYIYIYILIINRTKHEKASVNCFITQFWVIKQWGTKCVIEG